MRYKKCSWVLKEELNSFKKLCTDDGTYTILPVLRAQCQLSSGMGMKWNYGKPETENLKRKKGKF